MIDVSDYIIEAFNSKWGTGMYIKSEDEEGNPTLIVNLIGVEEFELDLKLPIFKYFSPPCAI